MIMREEPSSAMRIMMCVTKEPSSDDGLSTDRGIRVT